MKLFVSITFMFEEYDPRDQEIPKIHSLILFWKKFSALIEAEMDSNVYVAWHDLKNEECLSLHVYLKKIVDDYIAGYKFLKVLESLSDLHEDRIYKPTFDFDFYFS